MHVQTTDKLSTLDSSFTNLNAQQTALSQNLITLDSSLAHIESRAQSFHDLQLSQFENQNALQANLQKEMQATREKLQAIDSTASNIGQNINDLYFLIGKISSLGGIVGTLVAWKWPVLVVLAIAWFSARAAALTALSIGEILFQN
jgi:predicted  nucleic acid-binding Zn-ribbon protein